MPVTKKDFASVQAGANQAAESLDNERAAKLKAYLQSQAVGQNIQRANEQAKLQGLQPGKYSVNASDSGIAVNPESEGLMAMLNLRERQDARDDRDLVTVGERADRAGIPGGLAAAGNLETMTAGPDGKGGMLQNPDYKVKSAGPIANFLPQSVKNLGESIGLMPKGSSQESALVQRLVNADIRSLSGTAVTTYEQGRQNVEKGMSGFGDPNLVKIGIKQMADALDSAGQNIESSSRPEIVDQFREQGGALRLRDYLQKKPAGGGGGFDPDAYLGGK